MADWDSAAEILDSIEWDDILSDNVNLYWSAWKHFFLCDGNLYPHTVANIKGNSPLITKEVLSAIKKRDILFQAAKSTGNPADRAKYNSKRNEAVKMLRECKQSFLTNNSK